MAAARRIGAEIKLNMKNGKLRKMPLEYFATAFFGLLFFPFVGRNMICGFFFGGDGARFEKFVLERRKFMIDSMKTIFNPKRK